MKENLSEKVILHKVDEKLSALGNVICCNDYVALIHPELESETEQVKKEIFKVEVYANNVLVGSYCFVYTSGGILRLMVTGNELEELSNIFQKYLAAGAINRGKIILIQDA